MGKFLIFKHMDIHGTQYFVDEIQVKEFFRLFVSYFPFTVQYVITSVTDQNMEYIGWRRNILMTKLLLKKTITPKGIVKDFYGNISPISSKTHSLDVCF
jgi:hypothetical protein